MQLQQDMQQASSFRRELTLLFLVNLFLFTGAGAQQQYLIPYVQKAAGWSPIASAWVLATVYCSMMVFRVGNLFLLRRLPLWLWTIVGSSTYLFFTLACLAVPWHQSYALAIASAIVWGWGGAAFWGGTTIQTFAAADQAKRYGAGTGILYAGSQMGWVIGLFVLGQVYAGFQAQPWMLYLVATIVTLPGVLLTPLLSRKALPDLVAAAPSLPQIASIMFRAKALISAFLLASTALCFGIILGIGDFVEHQYGPQWIWIVAIFYPLARLICSLLSGVLTDKVGGAAVLATGFFSGTGALFLAGVWHTPLTLGIAAFALGFLNGAVPVVATAIVGDSAKAQAWPLAYGALFTWQNLGIVAAVMASKVLGVAVGDYHVVFQVFAGVFAFCGLVALLLQRYASQRLSPLQVPPSAAVKRTSSSDY